MSWFGARDAAYPSALRSIIRRVIIAPPVPAADSAHRVWDIEDRVADRLATAYLGRVTEDAFAEATARKPNFRIDGRRLRKLLQFLDESPAPVFARAHFIVTHGEALRQWRRTPEGVLVEEGDAVTAAGYEDAVGKFDGIVADIVQHLRRRKKFDDTLLVVYSDHGRTPPKTRRRPPLLIRFPRGEHAGRIAENVRNLDILPTVAEALGLPRQPWAEGRSLISGRLDPGEPLFAALLQGQLS